MGDQRDFAVAGANGGHCVGHVNDKRGPADGGTVGEPRLYPQVFGGGKRGKSGRKDAVDVALGQAGVLQGIMRRFGVVLEGRLARHVPHYVGLGHADDGDVL